MYPLFQVKRETGALAATRIWAPWPLVRWKSVATGKVEDGRRTRRLFGIPISRSPAASGGA